MKKFLYLLLFILVFSSCKSHKLISNGKTSNLSTHKLLKRIDKNRFEATTFESRFNVQYKDQYQNFNGNGKIRIFKDSIIWGSINFMGIPVVKFYLTPSSVQYYNKIEKKYYSGDYSKIREILGADLDFYHLQNLLVGDPLFPVSDLKDYQLNIAPTFYRLQNPQEILTELDFSPSYKVVSEKIIPNNTDKLIVRYSDFEAIKNNILPKKIRILNSGAKQNLSMDVLYKNISLNKDLHFPFSIPSNYSKIVF